MKFIVEIDCDNAAFRDQFVRQDHPWVADPDAPNPEACVTCGDVRAGHDDGYERKREVSRILSGLAWTIGVDLMEGATLRDLNGATVGRARFVEDEVETEVLEREQKPEVGGRDWTLASEPGAFAHTVWCGDRSEGGAVCTRDPHDARLWHVAGDGDEIVEVWL